MSHDDPGCVSEQYRDASIYRFDLPDVARILEVGCGPGNLRADNLGRLPEGWKVTLTDASPGMIQVAKNRLADYEQGTGMFVARK